MYWYLKPAQAILNDINEELINAYKALREEPEELIRLLTAAAQPPNTKEKYLKIRGLTPEKPLAKALRFLYLNKTCFNGLYRVNASGQFNVPFGGEKGFTAICDVPNLVACSNLLKGVQLTSEPFENCINAAKPGDFIYADPPYLPVKKDSFTKYDAQGFGIEDHQKLAKALKDAQQRGCHVLASNSYCPETFEIFKDFTVEPIDSRHSINSDGDGRKIIKEVLIY